MAFEAKIKELLHNLCSMEIKIYSEASKEFISILGGDSGGHMLIQYVNASPSCSELMEAWKLRKGKPGMVHVFSLISLILRHPDGKKYKSGDGQRITVSRRLDKVAHSIIETKLEDIYEELNSKESRRQNAALSLLSTIVRRGIGLASEVGKNFDFKLPIFTKLAEYQKKKPEKKGRKHVTRRSFIEFAMSFLEVGNPRLLRWVLQQKEMYSSVLCLLGGDDDEIVIYVLSVLRDRVLTPDSLVPPGLRSVLFGSIALDQLVNISANPIGGLPAQIAHEVLIMVCTDPCNGLMPDLNVPAKILKGNPRRLLELMKKLKATENDYHKDLLLAIVNGWPTLGSAYMEDFPYVLEPRASSTWIAAILLVSDLVAAARKCSFGSLTSQDGDCPSVDSSEVQCLLKCILPRSFARIVINRGLLHSDVIVKHATLKFLLEALKSLESLLGVVDYKCSNNGLMAKKWASLKQETQDEVRAFLPDPQVLLKLLSSFGCISSKNSRTNLKRSRKFVDSPKTKFSNGVKKLKPEVMNEDIQILVSGISGELEGNFPNEREEAAGSVTKEELGSEDDCVKILAGIWGTNNCGIENELKDAEAHFHSKLLDALTLYLRTIPNAMDRSYDFFKLLPTEHSVISINEQQSLLSLLIEFVGSSPQNGMSVRPPELIFKHLQPLINLLYSPIKRIRDQAYILARVAMLSTGAFDRNIQEVDVWLLFLPGYKRYNYSMDCQHVEVFQDFSVVVSFLSDAVSTMGNNLYKYLHELRCLSSNLESVEDVAPDFSPLVICILRKCLRLLESGSGTFKLSEKSMISIYVCNAISLILQTQARVGLLCGLIDMILNEKFGITSSMDDDLGEFISEWRPLKSLVLFSRSVSYQQASSNLFSAVSTNSDALGHSFARTLHEIKKMIQKADTGDLVAVASAFCSSIICTIPDAVLQNFPTVITVFKCLFGEDYSLLSFMFFHERKLLVLVADLWPDVFISGLELATLVVDNNCKKNGQCLCPKCGASQELVAYTDTIQEKTASCAFSLFLKQAPFQILFPAVMQSSKSCLLHSSKMVDLFCAKLSEGPINESVASLRLILFWVHQLQSLYRVKRSGELEHLSEICFLLLKYMVSELLFVRSDFYSSKFGGVPKFQTYVLEAVETIIHHPAVTVSLTHPVCCHEDLPHGSLGISFEKFISQSKGGIHPMDCFVQLLPALAENISTLCKGGSFASEAEAVSIAPLKAFKFIVEQVVSTFRCKFEVCICIKDLTSFLPTFNIFRAFIPCTSPFMLLELVNWIFGKVEQKETTDCEFFKTFGFTIACHISEVAFELLSTYLNRQNSAKFGFGLFWELEGRSFDVSYIGKVYNKIVEIASCFELESADRCLSAAVNIVYKLNNMQHQITALPGCMELFRVVLSSPIEVLVNCTNNTDAKKAKLLFFLTESSALHLILFGKILTCVLNKDLQVYGKYLNHAPRDEELIMLVPVVFSWLKLNMVKFGSLYLKHLGTALSVYSRILLDGFVNWKSFTSRNIFQEEYGEDLPSSSQELLKVFSDSVLGKAICLLQYHFALHEDSTRIKKRLKLFECICPYSSVDDDFLDFDLSEIKVCSLGDSLNLINRVIAKISFCWMLLFPKKSFVQPLPVEIDEDSKKVPQEVGIDEGFSVKMRFINLLVSTLNKIVKGFPLVDDDSEKLEGMNCSHMFRCLEAFILRNIVEFSMEMKNDLIQSCLIPFIEPFVKSSFLYRFEDPTTLRVLRTVLILFSEGNFCCTKLFELLLEHSHFVPTILWRHENSNASAIPQAGVLLKPMSSILNSQNLLWIEEQSSESDMINYEVCPSYLRKLEVIRLLRSLYHLRFRRSSLSPKEDANVNCKELVFLLLSCYDATMSEVDMEIFELIREILSTEGSNCLSIAEMDYLWGSSAMKLRREKALEKALLSNDMVDCEMAAEQHRRQFREYFALDHKLCIGTIVNFPYHRTAIDECISLKKISKVNVIDILEAESQPTYPRRIRQYDPVFLLHFSIHVLSMGFLEPLEFVGLGLLAIAFVSISSPDDGMRKLGYDALGRFKNALESCRKRKDGLHLRLLLTYLQNGISEPWQRIPSAVAIFSAEASFILLDPSHDHYATISKVLMRSSRVNLKCIPLFHAMFGSTSVNFKADRMWMLRLLYVGLNLDVDAHIFMRKGLFKILLSFYYSSLCDCESKILILQIVKKSVKLPALASYLVEHCNLISWLSSILSFCGKNLDVNDKSPFVKQMKVVLEVVSHLISSRFITEWLQKYSMEQLSELLCHVLKLFTGNLKMMKQNVQLINSLLGILVSTLRISQKRKIYQPHFTLSCEYLFQICQAIGADARSGCSVELGLEAMLMRVPPAAISNMDKTKLSEYVKWGICTASKPHSKGKVSLVQRCSNYANFCGEEQHEDSPISKLLRWATASVILGEISRSCKTRFGLESSNIRTLQALLKHIEKKYSEAGEIDFEEVKSGDHHNNETLAAVILYLQQLLGIECKVLPSVICALSLLIFSDASNDTGKQSLVGNEGNFVAELYSKIRSPVEANPAWRWSYYKPWQDLSSTLTELEKMEECHACQTLLVIFSNALGRRSSELGFPVLSHQDVEKSGVFEWERSILMDK